MASKRTDADIVRTRRVQELRRSNAAGAPRNRRKYRRADERRAAQSGRAA